METPTGDSLRQTLAWWESLTDEKFEFQHEGHTYVWNVSKAWRLIAETPRALDYFRPAEQGITVSNATVPSPVRMLHDGMWRYRGYHDCPSICYLRIFEPVVPLEPLLVVFTELRENTGTSITNRIEHLATQVWHWLERPERNCRWVEHYQSRGVCASTPDGERWQFKEEFDFVEMSLTEGEQFKTPVWKPSTRTAIEEIIGQPFPG